jgi:serine/threonine protein kinase
MSNESVIGKTIDGYRVEQMLGQGGMAAVYEAVDLKLDRPVAMKVMHAHLASQRSFRDLFVREAQNAARLDHPNIVSVFGFNVTGDYLYIVMELIEGGNLRKYVKRLAEEGQFVDYPEAAEIVRQVAAAMHYAHERGMVHRDLKPDNIILKPLPPQPDSINYQPIVTDFGLAQLTTAGDEAATATQPIGTYPYMSPEQVNAQPVDRRTDIYAMGIVLYELSLGRLPYNPKSIAEAARMHGREPIPVPSDFQRDFPEPLENIILKAMAKSTEDRYQTAAEVAEDLTRFIRMGEKPRSKLRLFPTPTSGAAPSADIVEEDEDSFDDPEFSTAVQTATMDEPLPPRLPDTVKLLRRTPKQRQSDYLALYSGTNPSRLVELPGIKSSFSIGREFDVDIVVDGELISRRHGTVERKPNGRYFYTDHGSTNGTWIGDDRLAPNEAVIMRRGDLLRMGEWWVQFLPASDDDDDDVDFAPPIVARLDDPNATLKDISPADIAYLIEEAEAAAEEALEPEPAVEVEEPEEPEQAFADVGPSTDLFGIAPPDAMPQQEPPRLTAEQVLLDRIVIYHKGDEPRLITLERDQYTVGRAADNDIVLASTFVSRYHARFERDMDNRIYVRPLQTRNGTWMEQRQLEVDVPSRLSARRPVRIGDYWITFEAGRNIAIEATASSASSMISRGDDDFDDSIDTVAMVRPIDEEIPNIPLPPISEELRAADRLVFLSEDQPIQIEPLDKETITIGRGSNQDIRLRGKRVSREHVIMELRPDGNIYLTDMDARNGVWVGDTLLVPQTQVLWAKHESLRIGNYWVKFERSSGPLVRVGSQRDRRGLIGRTLGNYRIDRYIGESAISATYKATDLQLNRDVALKIMHPQLAAQPAIKQRFLEEARLVSRLDHPNVVQVMSYNELRGELFMVMELITGGNLRRLLLTTSDRGKQLELDNAAEMVIELANGLHYAHQQGLIHRDINPDNIMLKASEIVGPIKDYTPILTDFAVMNVASPDAIYDDESDDVHVLPYLSPEQCLGERNDARSDIYELGITFYEMLVGRPPFSPKSLAEAIRMHTREEIPAPSIFRPDISPEVEAVMMRALARRPNDRYQTAVDFARALQRAMVLSGGELASSLGDSYLSSIIDEFATQTMETELPPEMPLLTQPPIPEGEINHDRLVFYSENHPTVVYDVDKPVVTVGRGDDMDIVLEASSISRRHLRIERSTDGTFRVRDEGSVNGTLLGNYELIEGVLEIWEPRRTVRVGDYWLRLETRDHMEAAREKISLVSASPEPDDELYQTNAGWSPPADAPQPEHDKIGVAITQQHLTVVPGSSVVMTMEITNQNDFVDHFNVEVVGLPREWFSYTGGDIDLLPYNRETTSITFHPPVAAKSTAGAHAFEVRVTSQAKRISAVRRQCSLDVQPYYGFRSEIYPERVRNRGNVELTVRNNSNTHTTFNIAARDREQAVRFTIEGGVQYALGPGAVEDIGIRVEAKRRPLFGVSQFYPMDFVVTPVGEVAGGPQTVQGELAVTARFRVWMFVLPLLLLLLCAGLTAAGIFWNRRQANIEATAVAMNQATAVAVTATAELLVDDDGDGLTNLLEAELGTFPNLRDSDEDGLDDGTEYRVWSTDPLNRDTDGDGLSDGEEVLETGTNPLKEDTDGDEIPDPQDLFPGQAATPTPTPFPVTADGCASSPPPRLTAETTAFVETGGVANRLRAEPSVEAEILDFMQPDAGFVVLEGPTCGETDFLSWWKVNYNGVEGWTAEGEGEEYYLRPEGVEPGEGSEDGESTASTDTGNESSIDPGTVTAELPGDGQVALQQNLIGLQLYSDITPAEWETALGTASVFKPGWIKLQANWRYLQPDEPGQIPPQLSDFYSHINAAKANGYRVLISVAKAPDWARSTTVNAGPPDNPEDLASFITQMLMATNGNIDAIEVWNEPNLTREWTGTLEFSGNGYMSLFMPSYDAIRAYNPNITIVTAGLAPAPTAESSVDDREFLRQMYARGLGNLDGIALGVIPTAGQTHQMSSAARTWAGVVGTTTQSSSF